MNRPYTAAEIAARKRLRGGDLYTETEIRAAVEAAYNDVSRQGAWCFGDLVGAVIKHLDPLAEVKALRPGPGETGSFEGFCFKWDRYFNALADYLEARG